MVQDMGIRLKAYVLLCFIMIFSETAFSKPASGGTGGSGSTGTSGNFIKANPNDYFIASDITLPSGDTLYKGDRWYTVPNIEQLRNEIAQGIFIVKPDQGKTIEWAKKVIFGYDIMTKTYQMLGPIRKDGKPALFSGQVMNCSACHAQGGTVPHAWPFFRTATNFDLRKDLSAYIQDGVDYLSGGVPDDTPPTVGELYGPLGYKRDSITVNRDCGINCAGQGHIPFESEEMQALVAWTYAVRDGIYEGEGLIPEFKDARNIAQIPGARIPVFTKVTDDSTFKADPLRGKTLYDRKCASCHARDGLGKWSSTSGYTVPPVTGPGSHTKAGGPYMVPVLAAFIKRQMPLSQPNSLSEQDAIDITAYINQLGNSDNPATKRESRWWEAYYFEHDPCARTAWLPADVGVMPAGFVSRFSPEQTMNGPWKPIRDWLTQAKHVTLPANQSEWNCRDYAENTKYDPLNPAPYNKSPILQENFDAGFDEIDKTFKNPGYEAPRR
ncbi:MAG: c-type cytochrome [Methylomicrobium sp.]